MMTRIIAFVVILMASVFSTANNTPFNATCEDEVPDCKSLHKDKLCNHTGKFKEYAALACRKTCGYCSNYCVDNATNCKDSTFDNTCLKNITWSLINCPVYCGFCGVLGRSCDKETKHVCKGIPGVSCKSSVCTCNAGFRPVTHIECEEVYWKRCNASENCSRLENSNCKIPQNPETTYSHWTNSSHCICKTGYAYNYENHSCDVVCPRPVSGSHSTIKNESLKTGNYTYGDIIEYVCETGYEFENTLSSDLTVNSTCKADKTWSVTPNCTIKVCPRPVSGNHSSVKNVSLKTGNYTYGDIVQYICQTGYEFENTLSLDLAVNSTCNADREWSITPNCTIKVCPRPVSGSHSTIKNESLKTGNYTYGDIIEYVCETGYEFENTLSSDLTVNSTCKVDKTWSVTPNCTIKVCPRPVSGNHSSVKNVSLKTGNYTYGDIVQYICQTGYEFENTLSLGLAVNSTCNADREWSITPNCTIKVCPRPVSGSHSTIKNESLKTGNYTYGDIIKYVCETGYEFENTLSSDLTVNSTCIADKTWSVTPNCTIKVCPRPVSGNHSSVKNVSLKTGNYTYGDIVQYICQTGYEFENTLSLGLAVNSTCNADREWSITPNCTIKVCPRPVSGSHSTIKNESLKTGNYTYGDIIKYVCETGYEFENTLSSDLTVNSTCIADKTWSVTPNCTIKVCPRPVSGNHSSVKNVSLKTGNYTYGDIVQYICQTGYEFENTLSLGLAVNSTCNADREWSITPNCTIKVCPNPENDNTTVVEPKLPKLKGNYTYEDTVKYKCIIGFEFKASDSSDVTRESKCTENGNWSITPPTCTIKVCPSPVHDTTTMVKPKEKKSDNFTYEDVVEYKCITGFEFNADNSSDLTRESECTENGNWSITPPTCTIKDNVTPALNPCKWTNDNPAFVFRPLSAECISECTRCPNDNINDCKWPSEKSNGKVGLTVGGSTLFNNTATYTCNDGYETKDNTSVTCNATGNWSSPAPTCTDIDECRILTDDCHKYAACTNTNGSYTCECRDRFEDISVGGRQGINCTDINECDKNKNPCNTNGSQCINYPGKYFCMCDDGWTGENCTNDIDECLINTTCGQKASCTNYNGSYSCNCKPGFPQGNPKIHCYEKVIIKLETNVSCSRGDDQLIDAKPIPYRIPYFGDEYSSYRPNMNGFLTLGYQPIYENYGPEKPEEWKQVTRGYTVIAPLWTNIDSTNLTGGLCVHLLDYYAQTGLNTSEHRDLEMLGKKFSNYSQLTNFKPRIALVATWINVTSSSYIPAIKLIKTQNATMQAILISDGIYSYIMFNYDQEQWSLKMDRNIPSSAGFSLANKTGYITATQKTATNLNNGTNVNPGLNGRWIYNVSSVNEIKNEILKNESECLEFSKNTEIRDWLSKKLSQSDACPCSEIQIQLDYSYHTVDPIYHNQQFKMTCYEEWFFNNDGVKQTCCYRLGALKKENTGGGFASFEDDTYDTIQYFYKCCDETTDRHLCHLYYEMNPSDDCSRFEPADEPMHRYKRSLIGYMILSSGDKGDADIAVFTQRISYSWATF